MDIGQWEFAYAPTTGVRGRTRPRSSSPPMPVSKATVVSSTKPSPSRSRSSAGPPKDGVPSTLIPAISANYHPDGARGLYLHPIVWHGAVVPLDDEAEFLDRQGRVHARVSVDFVKEFGCYLAAPLRRPTMQQP
jgi:hypothetical protein